MKIITSILFSGVLLIMSGCMTEYVPVTISASHPASAEAEESSVYESSTSLDWQDISGKEHENNNKKKVNTKPMSHMKGMNHNAH